MLLMTNVTWDTQNLRVKLTASNYRNKLSYK